MVPQPIPIMCSSWSFFLGCITWGIEDVHANFWDFWWENPPRSTRIRMIRTFVQILMNFCEFLFQECCKNSHRSPKSSRQCTQQRSLQLSNIRVHVWVHQLSRDAKWIAIAISMDNFPRTGRDASFLNRQRCGLGRALVQAGDGQKTCSCACTQAFLTLDLWNPPAVSWKFLRVAATSAWKIALIAGSCILQQDGGCVLKKFLPCVS